MHSTRSDRRHDTRPIPPAEAEHIRAGRARLANWLAIAAIVYLFAAMVVPALAGWLA